MKRSGGFLSRPTSLTRFAPLLACALVPLLALGVSRAQPPRKAADNTVRGKIERFTTAPGGEVDGAVLEDGTRLHWPPHMQGRFTGMLKKGDQVRASGRAETGPAGDIHLEVQNVTNLRTNAQAENPDFANGPPSPLRGPRGRAGKGALPPPPRNRGEISTVRGKIVRFTTAPRGEVDGAVLEDGTWLHWPPHMQDRFTGIVKEGDRVRATGRMETGPAGDSHFEVQNLSNVRTDAQAENPDFSAPPPGRRPAAHDGDREQWLRELEEQVQEILREIQRLRREK